MKNNSKKMLRIVNRVLNSKDFSFFILIASILGLLFSFYTFMIGFHNFDNCQNVRKMEYEMNQIFLENNINQKVTLNEIRTDGTTWSTNACYIDGIGKVLGSLLPLIMCSMSLGASLMNIYYRKGDK